MTAVPPAAATVISTDPVALGVPWLDDTRVMEVAGDGAHIVVEPYRSGLSGPGVDNQRWELDRVTPSGAPEFSYRVRNVGIGRCMEATSGLGTLIVLNPCNDSRQQVWSMPNDFQAYLGLRLVNWQHNACAELVEPGPDLARSRRPAAQRSDSEPLGMAPCFDDPEGATTQRWKLRTGPFDCGYRTRDWQAVTQLCIKTSTLMPALMGNWHNQNIKVSYLDPSTSPLTNVVRTYMGLRSVDANGNDTVSDWVEFGWEAAGPLEITGSTSYRAFWLEGGPGGEQYEIVPEKLGGVDTGSRVADGRIHTYMALGNQFYWALYYDFNRVTDQTTLQEGGYLREATLGAYIRSLPHATFGAPMTFRTQMRQGGLWRRPTIAETAVGAAKTCDGPPVYEDFGGGFGSNRPPYCVITKRTGRANPPSGIELDNFLLDKPRPGTVGQMAVQAGPALTGSGVHNGVDQARLARCLQHDPSRCLTEVPGLAACLAAHAICNRTAPATKAKRPAAADAMTLDQARTAASRTLAAPRAGTGSAVHTVTVARARTTTVAELTGKGVRLPADVGMADRVHVVAGDGPVRSLSSRDISYTGWYVVYHAATGVPLTACLGIGCRPDLAQPA